MRRIPMRRNVLERAVTALAPIVLLTAACGGESEPTAIDATQITNEPVATDAPEPATPTTTTEVQVEVEVTNGSAGEVEGDAIPPSSEILEPQPAGRIFDRALRPGDPLPPIPPGFEPNGDYEAFCAVLSDIETRRLPTDDFEQVVVFDDWLAELLDAAPEGVEADVRSIKDFTSTVVATDGVREELEQLDDADAEASVDAVGSIVEVECYGGAPAGDDDSAPGDE